MSTPECKSTTSPFSPVSEAEVNAASDAPDVRGAARSAPPESGGPAGPEPTRFGDWERNGRCIDF
jgi:hypothetical protein